MSEKEKEPKTENWKEELRQIVREELGNQSKPASPPSSEKKEETEKPHEHWKAEDLVNKDCPECRAEVEKIGKNYMKKVLTERKDLEYECEECGTPVKEDEEECPTCKGKKAKHR